MSQSTILSMLHGRASLRPNDVAFTFTDYEKDWAGVRESLTWSQLSRQNTQCGARNSARTGRSEIGRSSWLRRASTTSGHSWEPCRPGSSRSRFRCRTAASNHERVGAVFADTAPSVVLTTSAVGGRRRRLRRSVTHGHRAEDRRDRFDESGCRRRNKPSDSRFARTSRTCSTARVQPDCRPA